MAVQMVDDDFRKVFPGLAEFLMDVTWDDSSPRVTGTLAVSIHEGRWSGRLACRDKGFVAFLSAGSWKELLKALDSHLQKGDLEWRVDQFWKKPKK